METITIYEYAIVKGRFVKNELECVPHRNMWRTSGKSGTRFFNLGYAEEVKSGRIFSLNNDEDKYKQILIADLEQRIEVARKKLASQEQTLLNLKQ